ncbi:hypothetical protein HD806DRAFT_538359 [Xylariaceae sp. AK1471]|nr:hypothetical protein HD806DRAFT_538359 [Xylariaceae sp. AK1471]
MDYEDDEKLLRDYVDATAPLHVRRTLDQYYFPTLEDTSARDKDQVVYRGTKQGRQGRTRVVMVDQLWLWIINDGKYSKTYGHVEWTNQLLALIIIDQCSRVFFDRTKPLDQRPEVMDIFASAIGHVTEHTAVAYESFWRNVAIVSSNLLPVNGEYLHHKRLDINPEGILLQEAQDIAEELRIMGRIFTEQWKVTKDFKRYLAHPEGERKDQSKELAALENLLIKALDKRDLDQDHSPNKTKLPRTSLTSTGDTGVELQQAAHEAAVLLDHIEGRQAEIQDLEDPALRTCQQASIVEAKAALRRADESVKQGRAIMAFTLATIFFLPLGFIATFFGMNNREINGSEWMSLNEQIRYMFVVTIATVIVIISVAFSMWSRAVVRLFIHVPLVWFGEHTGIYNYWKMSPAHHRNLEKQSTRILQEVERLKEKKKKERTSNHDKGKPGSPNALRVTDPLGLV